MFTSMRSVKNIRANIKYPITDKDDQAQRGQRVEGAIFGGGLLDTGNGESLAEQFEYYLHQAGRQRHKNINGEYPIQGYIKIVSFSEKELSPDDPEGADKALAIVEKVQENLAPDTLWMAVAQKDGKRGLWHVHVVQNAVHSSTLKAMMGRETNYNYFREHIEETAVDMGITLDSGKKHDKRRAQDSPAKSRHADAKKKDGISWMDELQMRITRAAMATTSYKDFEENLRANGVEVSRKSKSGWTYALAECSDEKFVGKKARYDKFGSDFSQGTLNRVFDNNYKKAKAASEGRRLPDISGIEQNGQMQGQDDDILLRGKRW